tara:strand:- start:565 stop:1203 length:639 start_codon:yes stop_codon:yes gene_type:complete
VAAILDGLDGRVARMIKGTSEFGKELDSLTDFVSFGIAPAFIVYFWGLNEFGRIGWLIVLLFSVCCVLRLARFNLTKFENEEAWKSNYFQGIPSPAGGCLILFPIMYELSSFNIFFDAKIISPYLVVFVSFLLISKIPTFSFKKIVVQRHLTLFLLLGFGLFFVSIIQFTYETMVICSFVYVLLIPISVLSFRSKLKNAQKEIIQEDQRDIL